MLREQCKLNMRVYFGRENGEQTLGEIVKLNPTKAKVKTLESRGRGRGSTVGAVWGVPYSMLIPADNVLETVETVKTETLVYSPFSEDNLILEAIFSVYCALSPENLTADGERPFVEVKRLQTKYQQRLQYLQLSLGYQVSEDQVFAWYQSKKKWHKEQGKQSWVIK